MAAINRDLAEYMKTCLSGIGFAPISDAPTFNEFVMIAPAAFAARHAALREKRVLAGLNIAEWHPELGSDAWLFGVTETSSKNDIDQLVASLA